jgi:hypothetical protein
MPGREHVTGFALSIPTKKPSAWLTETDPKLARAWVDTLPIADSAAAARELYQAVYALNRQELDPAQRFEIMELYAGPVATVVGGLHGHLANAALPMSTTRLQLAQSVRRLYVEMANGYKCCMHDLPKRRVLWGRKLAYAPAIERALYYLGGVLLRSYLAYLPPPPGVRREIHTLYRAAETIGQLDEPVPGHGAEQDITVRRSYLRILLLAMANPYQLPASDQLLAYRFLGKWASAATMSPATGPAANTTEYLVDLGADAAPVPGQDVTAPSDPAATRVLDTTNLVNILQGFIKRIRAGETISATELGMDCLGPVSGRLLRHLGRSWSHLARRRHSRIRRHGSVSLCRGINALHFFLGGQASTSATINTAPEAPSGVAPESESASVPPYRIDRWRVHDISPQGLSLAYTGDATAYVRVGDVVGVQRSGQMGNWSAGIVRWLRSRGAYALEMGVELLAPTVKPVQVWRVPAATGEHRTAGLLLDAVPAAHRPESLLVPRGWHDADALAITELGAPAREIRVLQLIERNDIFEQIVFADVALDRAAG